MSNPARNRTGSSIATISVALVLLAPSHSSAQSAEAAALFDEGDRLMAAGKLAEACDAFEASNRIEARAGTLVRLGECREQNHQLASAWSAYKDALARVKDPRKREFATARVTALEPKLSHLTIAVASEAQVEGMTITRNGKAFDQVLWNRAVPVDGGTYTIVAHAPNRPEWRTTATVPVEGGNVRVEVSRSDAASKTVAKPQAPPPIEPARSTAPPSPEPAPPPPPPHATAPQTAPSATIGAQSALPPKRLMTGRRKLALGIGGAALATLGIGIALGAVAVNDQSQAQTACPDPSMPCVNAGPANSLVQSGHGLAIAADAAFGIAGVSAIAAGILWLTGGAKEARGQVVIAPTIGGFVVRGGF